jgi:hypothetical protein
VFVHTRCTIRHAEANAADASRALSSFAAKYSHLVLEMGWSCRTAHALRWQLPADRPDHAELSCTLARSLLSSCVRLAPALLSELLVPGLIVRSMDPLQAAPVTVDKPGWGHRAGRSQLHAKLGGDVGGAAVPHQPRCPWDLAEALLAPLGGHCSMIADEAEREAALTAAAQYATWLLQAEADGDLSLAASPKDDLYRLCSGSTSSPDAAEPRRSSAASVLSSALAVLDDMMTSWGAAALGASGGRKSAHVEALLCVLDAAVARDAAARAAGNGGTSDMAVYLFRDCCQLRARLLLSGVSSAGGKLPAGGDAVGEDRGELDASAADPGKGGIFGNGQAATPLWTALRREPSPLKPRPAPVGASPSFDAEPDADSLLRLSKCRSA